MGLRDASTSKNTHSFSSAPRDPSLHPDSPQLDTWVLGVHDLTTIVLFAQTTLTFLLKRFVFCVSLIFSALLSFVLSANSLVKAAPPNS